MAVKDGKAGNFEPMVEDSQPLWKQPLSHAHYMQTITDEALKHVHMMGLYTYAVNGTSTDKHVHTYQGHTLMADGHFHRFLGTTGPAIGLPNGEHYHRVISKTDDEPFIFRGNQYSTVLAIPRHVHTFSGVTGRGIGYAPDRRPL
jgi:hypothetical protein